MELYNIIPPEIKNDELSFFITDIVLNNNNIKNILEIGASSGMGSTRSILNGIKHKDEDMRIFCLEASVERCKEFRNNYNNVFYSHFGNIYLFAIKENIQLYLYNYATMGYLTDKRIETFYNNFNTNLNKYPLDQVFSWKQEELNYIIKNKIPVFGIENIICHNICKPFDMVIFDGSAFTGEADYNAVIKNNFPDWIILDDINDIKNYAVNTLISLNNNYEIYAINTLLRNGYAIYKKKGIL